jgi:DNA-binding NtrC family response regulator
MDDWQTHVKRTPIIIAEHYPLSRAALSDLLLGDGYRVFQSDNARSAISCIEQNKDLSVLLADLEMRGWKSLVQHTLAVAPNALIIAMLGSDSIVDPSELRRRGIKFWLVKPVDYEELERAIRSKGR